MSRSNTHNLTKQTHNPAQRAAQALFFRDQLSELHKLNFNEKGFNHV
ncbi:MAG: hypothetical protein IBX55_18310 [Methyloprofundus sp.]|nr:hypothetical protein [Methyloprofundus sp.]